MTAVDELVAFVHACLDRVERAARDAVASADASPEWRLVDDAIWDADGHLIVSSTWGVIDEAPHIALHDPASVLADVAAKRAILDLHGPAGPRQPSYACASNCLDDRQITQERPCATVWLLAQAYAGWPGWREDWRA